MEFLKVTDQTLEWFITRHSDPVVVAQTRSLLSFLPETSITLGELFQQGQAKRDLKDLVTHTRTRITCLPPSDSLKQQQELLLVLSDLIALWITDLEITGLYPIPVDVIVQDNPLSSRFEFQQVHPWVLSPWQTPVPVTEYLERCLNVGQTLDHVDYGHVVLLTPREHHACRYHTVDRPMYVLLGDGIIPVKAFASQGTDYCMIGIDETVTSNTDDPVLLVQALSRVHDSALIHKIINRAMIQKGIYSSAHRSQ